MIRIFACTEMRIKKKSLNKFNIFFKFLIKSKTEKEKKSFLLYVGVLYYEIFRSEKFLNNILTFWILQKIYFVGFRSIQSRLVDGLVATLVGKLASALLGHRLHLLKPTLRTQFSWVRPYKCSNAIHILAGFTAISNLSKCVLSLLVWAIIQDSHFSWKVFWIVSNFTVLEQDSTFDL